MASRQTLLFAALCLAAAITPADAQSAFKGWWVIVASYPTDPPERQRADLARTQAAAARCGAQTFNDLSQKFRGFAPGYNVFVVGAFPARADADRKAAELKRCFPGAYVKFGEHLGE